MSSLRLAYLSSGWCVDCVKCEPISLRFTSGGLQNPHLSAWTEYSELRSTPLSLARLFQGWWKGGRDILDLKGGVWERVPSQQI